MQIVVENSVRKLIMLYFYIRYLITCSKKDTRTLLNIEDKYIIYIHTNAHTAHINKYINASVK